MPSIRKPSQSARPPERAKLKVSREVAERKLLEHLEKGRELQKQPINSYVDVKDAEQAMWRWSERTYALVESLFTDDTEAGKTRMISLGSAPSSIEPLPRAIDYLRDSEWRYRLNSLQSLVERLDTYEDISPATESKAPADRPMIASRKVFVVHGHDNEMKIATARLLERLGLEAIILHEQPNAGRTLIEKFEQSGADARFAIVLLTPDDEARPTGSEEKLTPRARQNVILELGYFLGALGRNRVCALLKHGVEQPSDLFGHAYTPIDAGGAWQYAVAKELKAAGYTVDLNDV